MGRRQLDSKTERSLRCFLTKTAWQTNSNYNKETKKGRVYFDKIRLSQFTLNPIGPRCPRCPLGPRTPSGPGGPISPLTPGIDSVGSNDIPGAPFEPGSPGIPGKPGRPGGPLSPGNPFSPASPGSPIKPASPLKPEKCLNLGPGYTVYKIVRVRKNLYFILTNWQLVRWQAGMPNVPNFCS